MRLQNCIDLRGKLCVNEMPGAADASGRTDIQTEELPSVRSLSHVAGGRLVQMKEKRRWQRGPCHRTDTVTVRMVEENI